MSEKSAVSLKRTKYLEFVLNGVKQTVDTTTLTLETTLNQYLRNYLHLTGTKFMCHEGGCGACIVSVCAKNPHTKIEETLAVNSCLVSVLSCGGWNITTVEGLDNHEIQQKIVKFNGSQCGFCTPGMVMNMHALLKSRNIKMADVENSFGGNICRCTGYRSILSAFKSMASDNDESHLGIVSDIEDLQLCKKENCQATCFAPCIIETPFVYKCAAGLEVWYKVSTVSDIFSIIHSPKNANRSYKLVAGNTARGIYSDMDLADYHIDITGVSELRCYSLNTSKLVIGGNLTLTETMDVFRRVAQNDDDFKHLNTVVTHLDLVANVPVRNIGTIAGNLSIKYFHNEFPSDVFLLLEVIFAKLILDNGSTQEAFTPKEYLKINMNNRIILRIEIPPLGSNFKLETYKIMPRAQNAHAYVNAGFLFNIRSDNIVQSASIVFGGINPNFIHATSAETYISGKQLANNGNLQNLFTILNKELVPDHVLPDPSPEYRKNLAIALMYKYVLSIAPSKFVTDINSSGGQKLIRPAVSTGTQTYKTNKSLYPIGQPIGKLEAADQASGQAKYTLDLPDLPNQTFAVFVLAGVPPGSTLISIDAFDALVQNDVEAFFQASDIPGINSFMAPNSSLFYQTDEQIFLDINDTVKFYYQPVGMIVAKSQWAAEKAAGLVKLDFSAPATSPILTVRDVLHHNSKERIVNQAIIVPKQQDLDAPVKFTGTFDIGEQFHFHMEAQNVNVVPQDDGTFKLRPSAQWMDGIQFAVSRALNIPAHKLSISVKRVGGAFGGKLTRPNLLACGATLAALKLRKPVKCWLPMKTNMNVIGKRNPSSADYEVGVDANGKIGYLNQTVYCDLGSYLQNITFPFFIDAFLISYNNDAFEVDYNNVRTDKPSATWMRAPGSIEGVAMIESVLEHISYKVNKDPIDVRLANLNFDKHPILKTMIDEFLPWSDYRARRAEIETFNENNRWRKRGIAIIPMTNTLNIVPNLNAQVTIYQIDGTVAISHGGIDIGQGINTKAAQVAAYEFGIDISNIVIKPTNNFTTPNGMATGGAWTSETVCMGLQITCRKLKERIAAATKQSNLASDTPWPAIIKNAFSLGVNLTENQMWTSTPSEPNEYFVYGLGVSEVEIDVLTGSHIVQRVDLMIDSGDSLNPAIDIGQVEGAFVMGQGYWTSEAIVMDHDGQLKTNNTWTYKPPGAKDIPVDFRVKFPEGTPNPISPYKNKAITEPPVCLGFAVALAIKHALKTARTQADSNADPWVPIDGPLTVDWIFMSSLNDFKKYRL